jgi:hypothetical protein
MKTKRMLILVGLLILIAVVIAPTTAVPVTKNKYWGLGGGEWRIYYPDGNRELFSGPVEWKTSIWSNGKFQSIGQGELVGEVTGAKFVGKLKVTDSPDLIVMQYEMIGTVFFPDGTSQKYHSEVKIVQGTETVNFFKWG